MRFLLVEDNKPLMDGYLELLALLFEGSDVVTVQSVTAARQQSLNFDVIVTDYNLLGEEKGSDLVRTVREQGFEGIVIGMSNDPDTRDKFLHAGANAFYLKTDGPLVLGNLIDLLLP